MKTDESISLNTEFEKSAPALQLSKLHKRFGEFIAVNCIDLTIPSGSFYGVVGPNGAGKLHLYQWLLVCYDRMAETLKFLGLMFGVIQNKLKR